ncbi:hypothetical protein ACHAWC_005410, partial [Mediolabrus comicus]
PVCSLYADEAGVNDFVIRTAGHGQVGVRYANLVHINTNNNDGSSSSSSESSNDSVWVTSQSNEFPGGVSDGNSEATSASNFAAKKNDPIIGKIHKDSSSTSSSVCSISGRNVTSGEVLWRVNACSSDSDSSSRSSGLRQQFQPRHATLASNTYSHLVYSMDDMGVFRGWDAASKGMLTLDVDLFQNLGSKSSSSDDNVYQVPNGLPRLLDTFHPRILGTVITTTKEDEQGDADESLVLLDTMTGEPIPSSPSKDGHQSLFLSAKSLLAKAKVSNKKHDTARIVDFFYVNNNDGTGQKKGGAGRLAVLVAWSSLQEIAAPKNTRTVKSISSFSSMALITVDLNRVVQTSPPEEADTIPHNEDYDDWSTTLVKTLSYSYEVGKATPFNVAGGAIATTPLLLSSLRKVYNSQSDSLSLLAVASTTSQLLLASNVDTTTTSIGSGGIGRSYEIDMLHPYIRFIDSISSPDLVDGNKVATVTIAGVDDRYPTSRRVESWFVISLDGNVDNDALPQLHPFHRVYGSEDKSDEEILHGALGFCPDFDSSGLVVTTLEDEEAESTGNIVATSYGINDGKALREGSWTRSMTWSSKLLEGDSVVVPSIRGGLSSIGRNDRAHLLECSRKSMVVAFTSTAGMTSVFRFELSSGLIKSTKLWTSEEALGSVTSAVFLDETHAIVSPSDVSGNADEEEDKALQNLRFSSRIQMQLKSLKESILGGGLLSSLKSIAIVSDEKKAERDIAFGFAKVAVLLSETMHRIVALDTMKRDAIWSMNLHTGASWHKIIHGGQFISLNDPHGNGGVNDHEMLAMSYIEGTSSSVEWKCFDGLSGRTFSGDTAPLKSEIAQIVPLRTSSHHLHSHESSGCRQIALLVHLDDTITVIPDTARSRAIIDEAVTAAGKNGLFVHSIDKYTGEFRAQTVSRKAGSDMEVGSDSFDLVTVGKTIFDPTQEKIINVAYPRRGEVVQSPSTVLGDESLLLKYLNPHLVVVVTEATPTFFSDVIPDSGEEISTGFYNLLVGGDDTSSSKQKRKPLGAAKPGEGVPSSLTNTATPSLFVTLVDSVSGQILHRVSHSHADNDDQLDRTNVPLVVSENWVVYTFFNQRSRRTDVGVLTLHEGMIDKNGITAFSAPEQEVTFSSLESAKPIVLSRSFGLAKAVSALGVTSTKAGISSKQFMFATGNDQVISLDRRFLDPRRPNGELKESEKMEGLMKYAPMLPIIPFLTPSHVHEVASVQSIASASAHVESQSLVLAYGGPDIFFSRVSPSKGFDLLPDDFNRGLLTVVLVGLLLLLNVIQRMNKKKSVTSFWS